MSWRSVMKSAQALIAHSLIFLFTILVVFKVDRTFACSWWLIFIPLRAFHIVVARGRFSLPAPSAPHDRQWAPCHAVVALPLLIAFELLLCIHLENPHAVSLSIVFIPLLAFEITVLVDNFRMCKSLMPGDEESITDEAVWETLPHFWVAVSMLFFVTATVFTLLKLHGDVIALSWRDLFINFGIAQIFAFLVCTRWSNPLIHRNSLTSTNLSSKTAQHMGRNIALFSSEEQQQSGICSLQNIGGHLLKIPLIAFEVLLCMHLEGVPVGARDVPLRLIFCPLFLLEGFGVLIAAYRMVQKLTLLLSSGTVTRRSLSISSHVFNCFEFLHRGSRLLGWWSIDEGSHEEYARLYHDKASGYNTFCRYSPDIVKKMPKKDLAEEVWRLQAALGEQVEITKYNQQEFDRLQHEKIICRICFEGEICTVLLPCRHRALCRNCAEKCKKCPICRVSIEDRLPVYDV